MVRHRRFVVSALLPYLYILLLTLGGRVDHYAILSKARFSPRAGVNVRLTDTVSWNSSAGSYYQQPAFLFVTAFPQNGSPVPYPSPAPMPSGLAIFSASSTSVFSR